MWTCWADHLNRRIDDLLDVLLLVLTRRLAMPTGKILNDGTEAPTDYGAGKFIA